MYSELVAGGIQSVRVKKEEEEREREEKSNATFHNSLSEDSNYFLGGSAPRSILREQIYMTAI